MGAQVFEMTNNKYLYGVRRCDIVLTDLTLFVLRFNCGDFAVFKVEFDEDGNRHFTQISKEYRYKANAIKAYHKLKA